MTGSVLSQAAQFFGFPQVSNFDILIMTEGTRYIHSTNSYRKKVFAFPASTRGEEVHSSPTIQFNGIFFGIDFDEIKKIAEENPEKAVGYVPDDPEISLKRMFSSEQVYRNRAEIIVPVTASMTKEDMHRIENNLRKAQFWYLKSTREGIAEQKADPSAEDVRPNRLLIAYRELLSRKGDEKTAKLAEFKAGLIARREAKGCLAAAYEIYQASGPCVPQAPEAKTWQPKLPRIVPAVLAA